MRDYLIAATLLAAYVLAVGLWARWRREDDERRRDLERALSAGRYELGVPAGVTKADVDESVADHARLIVLRLRGLDGRATTRMERAHG